MGLFKNIPTSNKAQCIGNHAISLSQELKQIIISNNCVDLNKISLSTLDNVLFMYDLEC